MGSMSSIGGSANSIETLVQQYMALERRPVQKLESQKAALNVTKGVYSDLNSKLKELLDLAEDLADTDSDSIYSSVKVVSDDSDVLGVTTGTNSAQGQYAFRIKQLATSTTMRSTGALNTNPSIKTDNQVVAGADGLDTDAAWADAGFDTAPDGTVTINGTAFTLADYSTVDDFMEAVNDSAANANIWYDEGSDQFVMESTDGSDLILSETGTNGFLTESNISSGTYTTNVSGLDVNALLSEANFDSGLTDSDTGSFKINGALIEWDAGEDTFGSIISDINSSAAGVTAFYDESLDKVVFTSEETGSLDIEWEDVSGSFLSDALKFSGVTQNAGQDAKFTINSSDASDEITKSSNNFTINGLNFTLKATTVENDSYADEETTAVTVNSEKDESKLKAKLNAFFTKFNAMSDYIKAKSAVDITTYTRGPLAGDTVFNGIRNSMMNIFLDQVTGLDSGKPAYLAEIGITLGDNLHASISDSALFSEWLDDDPQAISNLFNSENGVATQIAALLEPYTESYGIVENRSDGIDDKIKNIDTRIEAVERRLVKKEEYYRKQFSALQEMLNSISSQQQMVSSLMENMNSYFG